MFARYYAEHGIKMKTVLVVANVLLLLGISTLAFTGQPVKASNGTISYIYIRADGSIDPPDAPFSTGDYVTYFLLEDIANKSIIIERDNIIINGRGLTISGPEELNSIGVNVNGRYNVTIKNTNIEKFDMGIYVVYSSMITLSGNNVSNNKIFYWIDLFDYAWTGTGISVSRSNETCIFNNTASNNIFGISVYQSNNTDVVRNDVSHNNQHEYSTYYGTGISVYDSKNITVEDNSVLDNGVIGISMGSATMGYLCSNNTIRNNTITGHAFGTSSYGLSISWSRDNTITDNTICLNIYGVYVRYFSQNQTIKNNNITLNTWGVYIENSASNTISNNTFFRNVEGIKFENSASNNKILYNRVLNSSSFGIYIRSFSNNNIVVGNNVSYNPNGVRFTESNNNHIFWNELSSNVNTGLVIYYYSSNNEVVSNNISLNDKGVTITYGCYNTKVFHNNFVDNAEHVYTDMNSTWDDDYPCGGNYWSNYTGSDSHSGALQNEAGSDGIGDTPYKVADDNNTDRFPLMAPTNTFDAGTWDDLTCYVDLISNYTVSNFKINAIEKTVSFNVTGATGLGFCRIIIPDAITETLWHNNYTVLVNGSSVEFRNWTDTENTYIYFTYPHSTQGVSIIPEFPFAQFLTLLMILATFIVATKKRKNSFIIEKT